MCNYTLGYADGLAEPGRRRNLPTEDRHEGDFSRGVSDAERRRPFDPPQDRIDGIQSSPIRRSTGSPRPPLQTVEQIHSP